jgi:DNA-binding CsgD family transcriptional regulator
VLVGTIFSHRDVYGVLAVLSEATRGSENGPFGLGVIEELLRLIPADHAGYFEYDFVSRNTQGVEIPVVEPTVDEETVEATCRWMPLRDRSLSRSTSPLKTSDLVTPRELRRNPFYASVLRPERIEYELKLWLPAPAGAAYGFFFERGRGSRDFDERDRGLLALLRPHLAAVRKRWKSAARFNLTERETEILRLVARGLTNHEIADDLVISCGTVRTHLGHAFDKLGVHTRTGAVARAFG